MLVFLYGEDDYRSRQKLNKIKERAKKFDPQSLNITTFGAERAEFDQIKKAVESTPFLARTRLVILENILRGGKDNLKNKLIEFLKKDRIPKSSVLVFWEGGVLDKRESLFKILLKKADQSEDFMPFSRFQLNRWIEEEVKNQGGRIDHQALELLGAYVGNNLWQLKQEIKKLVLYKKGDSLPMIKTCDIEKLVCAKLDTKIFNFIDALALKNKKQSLSLLHQQLESGENMVHLLSMITYQFRNMILVSDLASQNKDQFQIVKEAGLHPYVVKKTFSNIKNFSPGRLDEIYKRLLLVDTNLKRTTQNYALSLDMLVSELCE
jgi:DNA polymerase-3 subunit delta